MIKFRQDFLGCFDVKDWLEFLCIYKAMPFWYARIYILTYKMVKPCVPIV